MIQSAAYDRDVSDKCREELSIVKRLVQRETEEKRKYQKSFEEAIKYSKQLEDEVHNLKLQLEETVLEVQKVNSDLRTKDAILEEQSE